MSQQQEWLTVSISWSCYDVGYWCFMILRISMIYDIKDIDVSSFSSNLFCVQGCIQSSNFQPKLFRNKAYFSGCFPFSGILFKSCFPFSGILFKTLHLQLKVRLVSYFSQTQTRSKPIRCASAQLQLKWDLNSSPPQASIYLDRRTFWLGSGSNSWTVEIKEKLESW